MSDYLDMYRKRTMIDDEWSDEEKLANLQLLSLFKVFNLSQEVKELLVKTSSKSYKRNLPFNYMWVEMEWGKLTEAWGLFGIMIYKKEGIVMASTPLYRENNPGISDIINVNLEDYSDINEGRITSEEQKGRQMLSFIIGSFANAFIDFINHPEVETKIASYPKEMNETRVRKGKQPIADKAEIVIKGNLLKYIYKTLPTMKKRGELTTHWVRGHFVRYKNQKRFNRLYSKESEELIKTGFYKDAEGIMTKWKLPFIRGKIGKPKDKEYILKK